MTVRIAHASIDERGKITGGSAGDQTGKEDLLSHHYPIQRQHENLLLIEYHHALDKLIQKYIFWKKNEICPCKSMAN